MMNQIFSSFLQKFVVVYMDDIFIYSTTEQEHLQHLRSVFMTLRESRLFVKLSKCDFFKTDVKFLGHLVGAEGVRVDPSKVAAVQSWSPPSNVGEVRSFLGFANFFRRFIQGYASLVAPLSDLLRKENTSVWSNACQEAFDRVKEILTTAPVLKMPSFDEPFEVWCDASGFAIGAILLQTGHPCSFESRKLRGPELNYHPGESELLAVIYALKTWRCYLEGNVDVTVVTDHNPLIWLQIQPNLSPKQVRWAAYLQRFPFTWKYIPGRMNVADPLSSSPSLKDTSGRSVLAASTTRRRTSRGVGESTVSLPLSSFEESCASHYPLDPWFSDPDNTRDLNFDRGLYFKGDSLCVPDGANLRSMCISQAHSSPYAGHCGIAKTTKLVQRSFWWPGLLSSVANFVKHCLHCPSCQFKKTDGQKPGGLLQPLQLPVRPWQSLGMDLITSLPLTEKGHTAILVIVDHFSKMGHFAPCADTLTAKEAATLFRHHVIRLHGCPEELVTDRDLRFTSHFFSEFCNLTGVKQSMSSAFHPESDGQTERLNRILEDMLRHFVGPLQNDWDDHLDALEFAYNNSWHQSLDTSPFKLVYGFNPVSPGEAELLSIKPVSNVPAALKYTADFELSLKQARACLTAAQSRQKAYADGKRRDVAFKVGEEVLLSTKNLKLLMSSDGARKLLPKFVGPFKVIKQINPVAYELELPETMKLKHNVFHVSLLKPFHSDRSYNPPALTAFEDEHVEYTVERILDHRDRPFRGKTRREYLVKWLGYGPEHNTFEPESSCANCTDLLNEYWSYRSKTHDIAASGPQPAAASRRSKRKRKL